MKNNKTTNEAKILNSEILFIYDAKMCNPNGDPDEENKPRMDYQTNKNLVSDVRLKRYIRDYLISKGYEIWVSKVDDQIVDATKRLQALAKKFLLNEKKEKIVENEMDKEAKKLIENPSPEFINWLLDELVDVRLFGATMTIKGKDERGGGLNFTGPVQFSWGYSLNPVEIVPSSSITSTFAGRGEEYGTIGKDWRVYYSLIAFYGIISAKRAEKVHLKPEDISLLDNTLMEAIPSEATTRSKIGQTPRFLLRVEYKEEFYIGDLRRYVEIKAKQDKMNESLREIDDFELDINKLVEILNSHKERIDYIYLWRHGEIYFVDNKINDLEKEFGDKIVTLPHNLT